MAEYLITGASGFIGSTLVRELCKDKNNKIKVLSRSRKNIEHFSDLDIEVIIGDIMDSSLCEEIINPNLIVIHLAGVVDISSFKNEATYKINIDGSQNIINACIKKKAKRLIYTSSTSVITGTKKATKIAEPTSFNPQKAVGHYAKTKAIATAYLYQKIKEGALDAVIIYPSAIIGPNDLGLSSITKIVLDYINNKFPFYLKGSYNFVDVRDVAGAIISIAKLHKPSSSYIISGEVLNLKEVFTILNKSLGRKKLPHLVPTILVKISALFVEVWALLRKKKARFTYMSIKTLKQNPHFDNSKAQAELDFRPRRVEESLIDLVNWLLVNSKAYS